ncbi:NAD-dependent protein deacylase [Planctomycetota bacterium]|nr:NAD-dependent protein deacylase [Planctomycetota bacterium]
MANQRIDDGLVEVIKGCERLVVLTGAGVSAGSGVPTFRDALEGLWAKYDPMELATPEAFGRDAKLVSEWYDMRRLKVLGCEPNEGHGAIVGMEKLMKERGGMFKLLTQNVDRLHQRAGSEDVVELHGSLLVWRDVENGEEVLCDGKEKLPSYPWVRDGDERDGRLMRPGVVWFGEMLPEWAVMEANEAVSELGEKDVFMSVGTSGVVYPAAGYVDEARCKGAVTVEVNLERTPISDFVDRCLLGKSEEILVELLERVKG